MKLTMLGTGHATVTKCYNTCFALTEGGQHFLVDAGGGNGILGRLKAADISITDIHDIFVTHEHVDHLLGVVWMIRMIGTAVEQGKYNGELRIYCHEELKKILTTLTEMTIQKKVTRHLGERIRFVTVEHGGRAEILGCETVFFDIFSTKAKQFGFTLKTKEGVRLTCAGDEPYNEKDEVFIKGSDWLMHEAFCLYSQRDVFKPYEKHHSTVKDACVTAGELEVPNLILYHTEDRNLAHRKRLYTEEGEAYYSGNLFVPEDLECFEL